MSDIDQTHSIGQEQHPHTRTYAIVVNGRPREIHQNKLTYLEVVRLAYPDAQLGGSTVYTVTYSQPHGGHEGSMVDGDSVEIKNGMIFNVTRTDKS